MKYTRLKISLGMLITAVLIGLLGALWFKAAHDVGQLPFGGTPLRLQER